MPALSEHYKKNKDSLIAKIFGAFTIKTKSTNEVHLVLMENTLQLKSKEGLDYIFDLKGSLVARRVKGKTKSTTTLKDYNFLMATENSIDFINIEDATLKKLQKVTKRDVDFLAS